MIQRGRHERSGPSWRPLPPSRRTGRHRRSAEPAVRPVAAFSIVAVLWASLGLGPGPTLIATASATRLPAEVTVVVPDPLRVAVTVAAATTPSTTSTTAWAPTTTTLGDPSPAELQAAIELPDEPGPIFLTPLAMDATARGAPVPVDEIDREDCIRRAKTLPLKSDGHWDRNLVAQMTHDVFSCLASVAGLDDAAPTSLRRWNGARVWGFESLADQVAAESIVVAYCESEGFRALTRSNAFGYAGLFQMGSTEMARFGEPGGSRYDPVDNAIAAANYFLYQYRNRAGWGGWSPWAVVNTNFNDEVNDQVKVPVLPRFVSTDPEFAGRRGTELPAWAVDPWSWVVPAWPGTGCPFTGWRWPAPVPLVTDAGGS